MQVKLELRWVAKRTRRFPRKYTQVAKTKKFNEDYRIFHWLMMGYWASLNLRWLGFKWPNGKKLALICVRVWSRQKRAQIIASQRKWTQGLAKQNRNKTQVFNLRQLAAPFGQGFILFSQFLLIGFRKKKWFTNRRLCVLEHVNGQKHFKSDVRSHDYHVTSLAELSSNTNPKWQVFLFFQISPP